MIQTGDIILKKGKGVSRVVGWYTDSPYTHVGIVYNYPIIIHSYIGGVQPVHLKALRPYDIYRLKTRLSFLKKDQAKSLLRLLMEKEIKYDYKQLVAYAYYALAGGNNKFNSPNRFICSELIDRIYKQLGYNLAKNCKLGDITPAEIANSPLLREVKI